MNHSVIEIFLVASIAYVVELGAAWFLVATVRKTEARDQNIMK